mgnify:CR=1 FL=1
MSEENRKKEETMEEPTREMEKETGAETDLPETEPAAEQEEAKKAQEEKLKAEKDKYGFNEKTTLKSAKVKGKKVTLKWKKNSKATGYEIYRATKKNGKYKKIRTIKKASAVTFTDSKVKKGKTYYYKVRAYKTVKGNKANGKFSAVRKVKIKK